MPSNIRRSHTSPVRRNYILNAPLGELDISVGDNPTASAQHDTERRAGLVLLLSPPSLQSRNPASGSYAPRHRYLGKSLVYTGGYGRVENVAGRPRGEVDGATDCRAREAIVVARNAGQEATGVGFDN